MAFQKKDLLYTLDQISSISPSEISKLRRSLAKRANQRMVEMEHSGAYQAGGSAYTAIAIPYFKKQNRLRMRPDGVQVGRFNEGKTPKSFGEEEKEVAALIKFLTSETSTSKGLREARKDTRRTLKHKYGISLTGKKVNMLFEDKYLQQLKDMGFGSDENKMVMQLASKSHISTKEFKSRFDEFLRNPTGEEQDVEGLFETLFHMSYADAISVSSGMDN